MERTSLPEDSDQYPLEGSWEGVSDMDPSIAKHRAEVAGFEGVLQDATKMGLKEALRKRRRATKEQ